MPYKHSPGDKNPVQSNVHSLLLAYHHCFNLYSGMTMVCWGVNSNQNYHLIVKAMNYHF